MTLRHQALVLSAFIVLLAASNAAAQTPAEHVHDGHDPTKHTADAAAAVIPDTRGASGTAWQPDSSPMYALHTTAASWRLMLHGTAFAQLLAESATDHRGSTQAGSINWFMGMAQRDVGRGRVGLRGMVSLEPWTIRGCGYPDLLATGEVCDGDTIHDLQHPHDFVMEAAAEYDRPLTAAIRWQIYGGIAGEPALGPVAFPHRLSALPNPIAPMSHHWLDATHITFGVVTTGLYSRWWKIEGSVFNGREPDERRSNVDLAAWDSFSARLSLAPSSSLALQVSAGRLRESEAGVGAQPRADKNRFTASAAYHRGSNEGRLWATTVAYGVNSGRHIEPEGPLTETTHAVLGETTILWRDQHAMFARVEVAGKPAHQLHAHEFEPEVFTVGKLQVGYVRYVRPWKGLVPGVGASLSMSLLPPDLAPRYEGRVAPGAGLFVTVRPGGMSLGGGHVH